MTPVYRQARRRWWRGGALGAAHHHPPPRRDGVTRLRPVTPWENAVRELAAWLAGQLPGLAEDRARALVEQAAGHGGPRARTLLEYVRDRPTALADPAPLLPPSALRLAHALRREGYGQVVLPRCARCGKTPAG